MRCNIMFLDCFARRWLSCTPLANADWKGIGKAVVAKIFKDARDKKIEHTLKTEADADNSNGYLQQMKEPVSPHIYDLLINKYIRTGDVDGAMATYKRAPALSLHSYSALLNLFINNRRTRMAVILYEEMLHRGLKVDNCTRSLLIEAYHKEGQLQKAQDALKSMVESGKAGLEMLFFS